MAIQSLNPYLNFNGDAARAVELYQRVLGAKLEGIKTFAELPDVKPENKDRVLHAHLTLGKQGVLMISDTMPGMPFTQGDNVYLTLHFDDAKEMEEKFPALAAGGRVKMPLHDAFWGARFGMLTDALGVHWMFSCELKSA